MLDQTIASSRKKLLPADMVSSKPDVAFLWRREMGNCTYDHAAQIRHWNESETIARMIMSTGAPTSSTSFDGESDE